MNSFSAASDLKMVTLECPYDAWDNPELVRLFSQTVGLKLRGYRKVYDYGVLPVDTTDFLATHHLVCTQEGGQLTPLMGFKAITLSRCKMHNVAFPLTGILGSSGARTHLDVLEEELERAKREDRDVAYASSWTILPEARENAMFASILTRHFIAMMTLHFESLPGALRIACGSVTHKTDQLLCRMGYERMMNGEQELPPFEQASLMGEKAVVLRCDRYSAEAERIAERYRQAWNERLVLRGSEPIAPKVDLPLAA